MTVIALDQHAKLRASFAQAFLGLAVFAVLLLAGPPVHSQKKKRAESPKPPASELGKLREEFIKFTKEYKASLEKLLAIYERDVKKAEERLAQSKTLYTEGLISKTQLDESENAVKIAGEKVSRTRRDMAGADQQIAGALMEAQAEAQIAKRPLRKGMLINTTAYIRYNGPANWTLTDAWKVQRFFQDGFKKPLPVAVFGQGAIHDRLRLDHRNAMDISLHPDSLEGQALINFLRNSGIPFLAFRSAIPGTATGPHIHIGRPSHRY